jgi:hypothetical protein
LICIAPALSACALSACALPPSLNVANLMHAHPTQESCTSLGLTLDPATKECVKPTPTAQPPAAASTVGPTHVAQAPSLSPPPPQQPGGPWVPIDAEARIDPKLEQNPELMTQLAYYVRASGYRCESISALQPLPDSRGYVLLCNRFALRYDIETKGERLTVTSNWPLANRTD